MALLEIKTVHNAKMLVDTKTIMALADETLVEGFNNSLGATVLVLTGGLTIRTHAAYDKIRAIKEKEDILRSLINDEDSKETLEPAV